MEYAVNKKIEDLAYTTGMFCDGTPDSWDSQAINNFALNIINDVLQHITSAPTQQLIATTFDLQLVQATKQNIVKHIRNTYGITQN